MASDVSLLIIDPISGCVVSRNWIGMRRTIEKTVSTLNRDPDYQTDGYESWGSLFASDVAEICDGSYVGGLSSIMVALLSEEFPGSRYWWIIEHDF